MVGPGRRVAARPKCRLLPARQRGVPGRTGRRVHVRRGARRDRLRHLCGECAAVRCGRQRGGRGRGGARRAARRPGRLQDRHRELAGGDDRRGLDADDVVRRGGVLGVRSAAVPVHRADAGLGAHPAAADDRRRQGRHGVRPLHHDGPGRGVPRAVDVRHVRRRLRCRSRGHGGALLVLAAGFMAMLAVRVPRWSVAV